MKSVLTTNPIFTPSTKTLSFSAVPNFTNNRLMVVVDQTTNNILYAESISGLGGTWDANGKTLTLQLDTTTGGYNSADQLQVIYDTPTMAIVPQEEYFDPVNKSRVSQPQSLIDTDFEYGLQSTKWEFVQLLNNKPTVFYDSTTPFIIPNNTWSLSANGSRSVSLTGQPVFGGFFDRSIPTGGVSYGTNNYPVVIYVQDATDYNANGFYLSEYYTVGPGYTSAYKYTVKNSIAPGTIYDYTKTLTFPCSFYSGASIPVNTGNSTAFTFNAGAAPADPRIITCTTVSAHNLYVGDLIFVSNVYCSTSPGPSGSHVVLTTPNTRSFTFSANDTPTVAIGTGTAVTTSPANCVYSRPAGFSLHRAYDGGIQFSNGAYTPNAQHIRQTRRYFRYQSGKGIQFSTGTLLKSNFNLDLVTYSGGVVTVNTKNLHGMVPGCQIYLSGAAQSDYNGIFTVASVPNDLSFTYTIAGTPTSPASASGNNFIIAGANSWYNGTVRVGMFDSQNGAFFEFDGQNLYVVRRNSTYQIQGNVSVLSGQNIVTGTNTRFADQLKFGDFIVIKGSSYRVTSIVSQTQLLISPEYRGPSIVSPSFAVVSKTIDTKVPQSAWNIDKFNGTGPSGYTVDLSKMQMLYIDYSWYGAGFIRWGMRSANGNVSYCHKMVNNNVNTEAYFRSGNLPARYEVNSFLNSTSLASTLASSETTTMNVADTSNFPSTGLLRVTDATTFPSGSAAIEYIAYTGKTATTFTGLTRAQAGGTVATTFIYSPTAPDVIELAALNNTTPAISGTPAAVISHWGSSVIMDGRFDNDLSYSFNAGNTAPTTITPGIRNAIMSLRLAPSVDSGRTGALGVKEVINRMQLKLQSMDISLPVFNNVSNNPIARVELNLNGKLLTPAGPVNYPWQSIGGSSLAQISYYTGTAAVSVVGGESIYGFFAAGPRQVEDLTSVRDLGNSILGGGITNFVSSSAQDIYPDGPDVLHVLVTPLSSGLNTAGVIPVQSRLSWSEAQA